jgi:hypothetical protein
MACNPVTSITGCIGSVSGGPDGLQNAPGWAAICHSFATAAQQLLSSFAQSFVSIPPVSFSYASVRSAYGLSLEIAALVAAVLLMAQVIRTVLTHDGSAIAQGLAGVGKAALAFLLTLASAATALRAADELTRWIIARSFGSPLALSDQLARIASFDPSVSPTLTLILALLGIMLIIALWAQVLVRNIAVTILVAVSPVAAAGQLGHATQQWWRKLTRATIQLIVLKPAVALILAVGLSVPSLSGAVARLLGGMLVLLLAACAWPAMARASALLDVHVSGGTLAAIRGIGGWGAAQAGPGGVDPAELSRVAEARTMAVVHESRLRGGGPGAVALGQRHPAAARADAAWPGPATAPGQGSTAPAALTGGIHRAAPATGAADAGLHGDHDAMAGSIR